MTIAKQIKWDFKANGELITRDKNGKRIYWEDSYGFWKKYEYDSKGNKIYYENSNRYWIKYEYDSQGTIIYWEDSDGDVEDNRPKPCENKVIQIDGIKYKLIKL